MNIIPEEFNLNCFLHKTINQVCYGLNIITLTFDGGYLQWDGEFSFLKDGKKISVAEVCPVTHDFGLLTLIEKEIILADTNQDRTCIILKFSDGSILEVFSDLVHDCIRFKCGDLEYNDY